MNGYGCYQVQPQYAYAGYNPGYGCLPGPAMGYQMPQLPQMDAYMGAMMAGGGNLQQMLGGQYADMERQIQMAQARMNQARLQGGRVDAGNNLAVAGEKNLMQLVHQGVLNREEFVAASATQNQIQRVLAKFKADGQISPQEQMQLQQLRGQLEAQLTQFAATDSKPQADTGVVGNQQSGALFDLMKQGKISPNQAQELRRQMAVAAEARGQEEGQSGECVPENECNDQQEALQTTLRDAAKARSREFYKLRPLHNQGTVQMAQPQGVYYGAAALAKQAV